MATLALLAAATGAAEGGTRADQSQRPGAGAAADQGRGLASPGAAGRPQPRGGLTARAPKRDRITFYFGLERPEKRARAAFFRAGDPRTDAYRSFLGVRQVGRRYGAKRATRVAFRRAARRHGLRARVHRSGVFARVRGTVGRFERVFRVRILRQLPSEAGEGVLYTIAGDGKLRRPRAFRRRGREVVAVYSRTQRRKGDGAAARAHHAEERRGTGHSSAPRNEGTWTDGCDAARATGAYSFAQVRSAYGIDAVGPGTGGSVAILNAGEGVSARDIADNARCFGYPEARTRTLLTDGQSSRFTPFQPAEPQEDLALARGMAPDLESLTFVQTWITPELWFLGAAKVLATRGLPDAFSISYGECERSMRGKRASRASRAGARLLDSLLARLGLAGVGSFASAGDFGSTCNGLPFAGVAWPASSPFLTAAGGTRLVLDRSNSRAGEVAWNDRQWDPEGGAGGGGLAVASRRPPYQRAVALPGRRRAVPDVSAHASMLPGWPVVFSGSWLEDGGTSASAPLLAGAFTALSARERAAGRPPLGPANGLAYHLARAAPETIFDVVSGDNAYDPKVPGHSAGPGYDLASGLGVPRFDRLADALPPPAATGSPPAAD